MIGAMRCICGHAAALEKSSITSVRMAKIKPHCWGFIPFQLHFRAEQNYSATEKGKSIRRVVLRDGVAVLDVASEVAVQVGVVPLQ